MRITLFEAKLPVPNNFAKRVFSRVAPRFVDRGTAFLSSLLLVITALWVSGCATVPSDAALRATTAVLPSPRQGVQADGRARFRGIFCALADTHGVTQPRSADACEALLWRLADEPATDRDIVPPPLDTRLQVLVVGGAFSDCFGTASIAYRDGITALEASGLNITEVAISGRSSAGYNAKSIAQAMKDIPAGPVVLLGYSKGTVDILVFLADYPELAGRVTAVISVAGPVYGSQLAQRGDWTYDTFLQQAFSGRCDPGDGGVLDSLLPEVRQQWLAKHPLPGNIRFYSLLAFTTSEHIARALGPSWEILAATDPRNDGQITIAEGILPGSTLLGYANTDHWGIAIDIEEELSFMARRDDETPYPRSTMFEALIRYVSDDLREQGGAVAKGTPGLPPHAATVTESRESMQ